MWTLYTEGSFLGVTLQGLRAKSLGICVHFVSSVSSDFYSQGSDRSSIQMVGWHKTASTQIKIQGDVPVSVVDD